ncbi:MAG: hypothetical protein KA792_02235 [Bacteroidales bacterium]|nr:hypothetical protein [Bacteroidales bacterium]
MLRFDRYIYLLKQIIKNFPRLIELTEKDNLTLTEFTELNKLEEKMDEIKNEMIKSSPELFDILPPDILQKLIGPSNDLKLTKSEINKLSDFLEKKERKKRRIKKRKIVNNDDFINTLYDFIDNSVN